MMQPSRVTRHRDTKKRHFDFAKNGRGASLTLQNLDFVPASCTLRPLGDKMIVEPLDVIHSHILIVKTGDKPMRGIVKAVGPGTYPKKYDDEKGKRTKMWNSSRFQPTEVKVGDVVHLGGLNIGGYSFESFVWGDKIHIHCREPDVCFIEVPRGT
jgi:co-chaperonin GroES (HSP10)